MFKITLTCDGCPSSVGLQAAIDISEEFGHRPWHKDVVCSWDGRFLILQAVNDFDGDGLALLDEFSDAISACITEGFDGAIRIRSITSTDSSAPIPTKPEEP